MKIALKTVTVKLESPDGDAEIVMTEMPLNAQLKLQVDLETEQKSVASIKEMFELIMRQAVSVSGMFLEDGTPVTLDNLRSLELPANIVTAIHSAYFAALAPAEKKENLQPASQSD